MLRFIIKRQLADNISGYKTEGFETVDIGVPELEAILLGGGYNENGHDIRCLAGVEVLPDAKASITCANCDTALPKGCNGIFKNDGSACALNDASKADDNGLTEADLIGGDS